MLNIFLMIDIETFFGLFFLCGFILKIEMYLQIKQRQNYVFSFRKSLILSFMDVIQI